VLTPAWQPGEARYLTLIEAVPGMNPLGRRHMKAAGHLGHAALRSLIGTAQTERKTPHSFSKSHFGTDGRHTSSEIQTDWKRVYDEIRQEGKSQ